MEEITKQIQNYNLPTSENLYQQTTQSNESYYTIDPPTTITNNNLTPNISQTSIFKKSYRKEIVIAKVIISELQEKINKKNIHVYIGVFGEIFSIIYYIASHMNASHLSIGIY